MDNWLLYMLKVSAGTILLYLCYILFFSKDTFYLRNRIFLILTLLLPTILPVLKVPGFSNSEISTEPANAINTIILSGTALGTTMSDTISSFDYNRFFIWLYFTVTALFLLRGVICLISTFRIIKNGIVINNQFPKVVVSDLQHPPFSFFPYVVIPSKDYYSGNYLDILDHENAHIRQGHTFDLLLSELFIAFQWINPFVWLIKRSMVLNHEYLADHVSLSKNRSVKEYQYRLLNFQGGLKNTSLAHNFTSLIKNRIVMINKKPTPSFAAVKNFFILPVLAIGLYAFTEPEYHNTISFANSIPIFQPQVNIAKDVKGTVVQQDGKPLEGAAIIVKGTSLGVSSDAKGYFKISKVPEEAMLVVSYVGFKSRVVKPDFASEMAITMMRNTVNTKKVIVNPPPPPLIVVDGIITDIQTNKIDPQTIKSVNVLKNESATSLYGEKGKNGVFEITTKKNILQGTENNVLEHNETGISTTDKKSNLTVGKPRPLILVNGFIRDIDVNQIDPNTIESITVLKDKSATSLYGEKGKYGVILISTKKYDSLLNPKMSDVKVTGYGNDQKSTKDSVVIVEEIPMFPGGEKAMLNFISDNLKYPGEAIKDSISGLVYVNFVVSSTGKLKNVQVNKPVHPLLDAEAIRVISNMPDWKPGSQRGKPVDVDYMVPVDFRLK